MVNPVSAMRTRRRSGLPNSSYWCLGVVTLAALASSTPTSPPPPGNQSREGDTCSWTLNTTTSSNSSEDWNGSKLDFSLSLFHSLYRGVGGAGGGKNFFFSPHSIHSTLLLTLLGSGGETETQLRSLLRVGSTPKATLIQNHRADSLLRDLECPNNAGVELRVATKLYLDKGETPGVCVRDHLLDSKELELLDIKSSPQDAITTINRWVENRTEGRIPDLLPPTSLSPSSRVAIVNAAWFRGVWEQQFKKSRTKLGLFYSSASLVVPTQFMHAKGHFRHGASEELKAYILELPYEGGAVSMFLLLPPFTPNAIDTTIAALNDSQALERGMEDLVADSISLVIPRFKLSHTLPLTDSLKSLGLSALFGNDTDLSGFSTQGGLTLEEGIHKATLQVDEEGATAAGATALIGTRSGRPLQQSKFVANHPFVILLWDKCRQTLLFMGVLHHPGPQEEEDEAQQMDATTNTT